MSNTSSIIFPQGRDIDFIGLGRAGIDLNANEIHRPMEETRTFTKYLGGSPANITIALTRLGRKCGFIGKVSDDQHGRFITNYFASNQVVMDGITVDKTGSSTCLAFTEILSPTDCSILMYRSNVADLLLSAEDVSEELIARSKILLLSGTALAASPSREAVFAAITYAKKHGTVLMFDLDYRPYTWKSPNEVSVYYSLVAEKCDVILGTREEFDMLERFYAPGNTDDAVTTRRFFDCGAKLIVIKYGQQGSVAYLPDGSSVKGGIFPAQVVKTFGAGDSYAGAFIHGLLSGWDVEKCMRYGAASASLVVSSHSCSDAMPTVARIERFIKSCEDGNPIFDDESEE